MPRASYAPVAGSLYPSVYDLGGRPTPGFAQGIYVGPNRQGIPQYTPAIDPSLAADTSRTGVDPYDLPPAQPQVQRGGPTGDPYDQPYYGYDQPQPTDNPNPWVGLYGLNIPTREDVSPQPVTNLQTQPSVAQAQQPIPAAQQLLNLNNAPPVTVSPPAGNFPPAGPMAGYPDLSNLPPVTVGQPQSLSAYPQSYGAGYTDVPGEVNLGGNILGIDPNTGQPMYDPRGYVPASSGYAGYDPSQFAAGSSFGGDISSGMPSFSGFLPAGGARRTYIA